MSKRETPLTRRYWQSVGGALIEEFPAVLRTQESAQRLLDGVIVLGENRAIVKHSDINISGKDSIFYSFGITEDNKAIVLVIARDGC